MSDSLQPQGLQHIRLLCLPLFSGVCSNSCSLSRMLSNHLILCCPLLLLPSIFPNTRVLSSELALHIRWLNIGASASVSVLAMNIRGWFPLGWTGWISLQSTGLSRIFSNTTIQKHQFFGAQPSLWSNSHIPTWLLAVIHEREYLFTWT